MHQRILCYLFALIVINHTAHADDYNLGDLIHAIQNLTTAINHIEINAQEGIDVAKEFLALAQKYLPLFDTYFASAAKLPHSIDNAVAFGQSLVPLIKDSCYFLGACILVGTTVSVGCRIWKCCSKKNQKKAYTEAYDF